MSMALLDMLLGHGLCMLRIALLWDLRKKRRKSQSEEEEEGNARGAYARGQEEDDMEGGKGGEMVAESGRE
jgi:hypothetical protein